MVTYKEFDFGCYASDWTTGPVVVGYMSAERGVESIRRHPERFRLLREMHQVRKFRLVLCADVLERLAGYALELLEWIVESERKEGGLDCFRREPLIISERRTHRTRLRGHHVGATGTWSVSASAL
jgi:hypothetical protein